MTIARPHRGYHGPRGTQRFFEGWYYRITLPSGSVATIYSIEDPHGGSPLSRGAVQILRPQGLQVVDLPKVQEFWADQGQLAFGQSVHGGWREPGDFWQGLTTGYQATDKLNQGRICTEQGTFTWDYQLQPVLGWGRDQATMGLLSYLPVYEVGWQVCMAHGWAQGFVEWQPRDGLPIRQDFHGAPAYIEKNWSLGFPKYWFWLQANDFTVTLGHPDPTLTLTSGGGLRRTLVWEDAAAMVGLHYRGRFFDFRRVTWQTEINSTTGHWQITAHGDGYEIELVAQAPTAELHHLQGPSPTATLHPISFHTLAGQLGLRLYRGRSQQRTLILAAQTEYAALEAGGDGWTGSWAGSC